MAGVAVQCYDYATGCNQNNVLALNRSGLVKLSLKLSNSVSMYGVCFLV